MRFSKLAVAFIAALPGITAAASAGTTANDDDSLLKGLRGPPKDTPRRELRMEKKCDIPSWLVPVGQGFCRDGESEFYDWGIIFYGPHLPLKTFEEAAEKCPRGPWFRGAENEGSENGEYDEYCTCLYQDRTGYEGRAKGSVVHNEPEMFAQVWTGGSGKGPVADANGYRNTYCYKYDKGADEPAGPDETASPKEPAVAPEEQKNNGRGPKVYAGGPGRHKNKAVPEEPVAPNGEDACQNHDFGLQECLSVGCCSWSADLGCMSIVGRRRCHIEQRTVAPEEPNE